MLTLDIQTKRTPVQSTKVQTRRTALLKRILNFRKVQLTYMPRLQQHLLRDPDNVAKLRATPESFLLRLPSSLGLDDQRAICEENIASIEERLRVAQANEALSMVQRQLQIRAVAYWYKSRSIASQRSYTWS